MASLDDADAARLPFRNALVTWSIGHAAHGVDERGEVRVGPGLPDAPGEQRVAREQVRRARGVVVQQRDRAGRVAHHVDHLERAVTHRDRVAVAVPGAAGGVHENPGRCVRTFVDAIGDVVTIAVLGAPLRVYQRAAGGVRAPIDSVRHPVAVSIRRAPAARSAQP